jgi:uncharacterized membrane protein
MTGAPDDHPVTRVPLDLVAVAVVGLLATVTALGRLDPWRLVLGWTLPVFLPGYALMAAVYPAARTGPGVRGLGAWERAGLSVVASVAVTAVLGIAFDFTPLGITLGTMAFGLALATFLFLVLAVGARLKVPAADRPHFAWGFAPDPGRPAGRTSPAMATLLAVSFAGMLVVLVLLFPFKASVDGYTNLYVLGDGGKAVCLPDTYTPPGQPGAGFSGHPPATARCPPPTGHVTVGIVNHEARVATYHLRVFWSMPTADPKSSQSAGGVDSSDVQLGPVGPPGEKLVFEREYERNVTLTPPPLAGLNRLNVQVYRDFGQGVAAEPDLLAYFYVTA